MKKKNLSFTFFNSFFKIYFSYIIENILLNYLLITDNINIVDVRRTLHI